MLNSRKHLGIELANKGRGHVSSLDTWQIEPILATVRDPGELAKLPDAEREQWQQLWADVALVIASDPLIQGRERVVQGDWAGAVKWYARIPERGPIDDGHFWFEYAAVLLLSGDRPGYRAACTQLIERCGEPGGPRAYYVARAGTLAADSAPDASLLDRLAHDELQQNATQFWSLTEQGALAYRAGRFEESVPLFEQSPLSMIAGSIRAEFPAGASGAMECTAITRSSAVGPSSGCWLLTLRRHYARSLVSVSSDACNFNLDASVATFAAGGAALGFRVRK